MDKHRIILGWLFLAVAALVSVVIVFALNNHFGNAETPQIGLTIKAAMAVAALFVGAGISLLVDFRYTAWICLPFSLLILFSFPVGTALGGYYLWYHWTRQYRRRRDASQ